VNIDTLRNKPNRLAVLAFFLAAVVLTGISYGAARMIEHRSETEVHAAFETAGIDWITLRGDGLQLHLIGTAPNEAARFRAVNLVASVIDNSRIRDFLDVTPTSAFEPPRFSVEILRNDDGVQLIGLLPREPEEGGIDQAALITAAEGLAAGAEVANMLDQASYPAPAGWNDALAFGLTALERLPRSKVSISAGRVEVIAISDGEDQRRRLETDLMAQRPEGVEVVLDISAPRPVISPFTLRFLIDEGGTRFDACSADTDRAQAQILATAGMTEAPQCAIGLGAPTPRWAAAASAGIAAVKALGAGSITFSDADISLAAAASVSQATFDRVVGELETALPDGFSLKSTLETAADAANQGPVEFTATLSAEGRVELRGRVTDERLRAAVDAYARAAFGADAVYTATRMDPELPDGWPVRVLAGIEALSELASGKLIVRADTVEVSGITGSLTARGQVAQVLSSQLGQGQTFKVDVRYDEALDPIASIPTPEECAADVNRVVAAQKITFTPASAEIAIAARPVIEALAAVLQNCPGIAMDITGFTDSQGSEGGNQALSQARAEAVLVALQGRRIDVSGMRALGYGEANPIADNATDAGREANRRIEFVLDRPYDIPAEGVKPSDVVTPSEGVAPAEGVVAPAEGAIPAEGAASSQGAPPADTWPSFAPTERTIRPKPRPSRG